MDQYEVMLIVIPELDEEQVGGTVARFKTIIERTGGEVVDESDWGRRKLAYEIDHRPDGFYYVVRFTTGERTLVELKRILRVSDDVLRHMIVKLPPSYTDGAAETATGEGSEGNVAQASAPDPAEVPVEVTG